MENEITDFKYITYETLDDGRIARIMLNRPESRNAQNRGLLVELDEAFLHAEADDEVRVVILGGVGPAFSSGHDLGTPEHVADYAPATRHPSFLGNGGTREGLESLMLQEWHYYLENHRRWRNLRKITIAQVQGTVFAGGLMLMWCCDLIVAADDTTFADVTGTRLGMCGVEYFAHPWEFGPRKTKELMLTGDTLDVDDAYRLGMVSKVFAREELEEQTLAFARRIAAVPTVGALLVKEAVNQTVDTMGFQNALTSCFTLHQLNHGIWAERNAVRAPDMRLPIGASTLGYPMGLPEVDVPSWRDAPRAAKARRDTSGPGE